MKTIKKFTIIALMSILAFSGCKKAEELLTFDITDSTDIVIENTITPFSLPFEIFTPEITTNSESEFADNDAKINLVKNILLTELNATIISPEGKTFSFLKEINVYISTNDTDELLLASKKDIDSNATKIFLDVTDQNLDKYVKSEVYNLRTEVVTRETLTKDVTVNIFMKYRVTVNL